MAQEHKPGQIVPQAGVGLYTISHDQVHADMPHEVVVIKGAAFRPAAIARASPFSSPMRRSSECACVCTSTGVAVPAIGARRID